MAVKKEIIKNASNLVHPHFDWSTICYRVLASRALDHIEEQKLVKEKKVLYQFSARGHDVFQSILGSLINHPRDALSGYYRSRPLMLSIGLSLQDAFSAPLMKEGGYSNGRDIGVVFNLPNRSGPCGLPMPGGVGAQYTPIAGWAQAIKYRQQVLHDESYKGAIAIAHGGEASVASNGFWSALTIATTQHLPMLFYIEDNGYGISVTSDHQTPGGNIAENLQSFNYLEIFDGDGTDIHECAGMLESAVHFIRTEQKPALVRLRVPRLSGHSAQDTQAYKSEEQIKEEWSRDPLPKLKSYLVPERISESEWESIDAQVNNDIEKALTAALALGDPDPSTIHRYVFSEKNSDGSTDMQMQGGLAPDGHVFPKSSEVVAPPEAARINMLTAIRRTLDYELATNEKLVVFGEDVGAKGGVHAATMGLQEKHGKARVFDTSLSEEGIIGRALGMAQAGLMPVPELQFRKYADPAEEQLNDCGTMRWRTNNRFAAPMVVRIPGGFFKCGDPWHSQCNEVKWVHSIGWQVAMPSNAEDAVGLLRSALRSNNPTIFFEHRNLLDDASARRPYPGDEFVLPFGKANILQEGSDITIVAWGAMVARCETAANNIDASADIIDLRTLMPWDKESVLASVKKTGRCLIVHEDNLTAGFGAEIAAVLADETFMDLDAPIKRLAMPDVASPHHPVLLNSVVPSVDTISTAIAEVLEF